MGDRPGEHDRNPDRGGGAHRDGVARAPAEATVKLLTAFVLCATLAAAQDKPQDKNQDAASQLGSTAGTVTTGAGGPPMKDVEVYVRRNTPQEQLAVTDQQGRYSIRDVAPGQIRISANAPDASGRTGFGPYASRQVTLAPGQELAGVDFRLVIQGQISGKVVDQNNEPVGWRRAAR